MKTQLTFLILAASALGFVSCTTTGVNNTAMVPLQDVEAVERQSPVTHDPNGLTEALDARNAVNYSANRRFRLGNGF
jgi:hypothetical protein